MIRIDVKTKGRTHFYEVTTRVADVVRDMGMSDGIITVYVPHTTAGVTINENADPDVVADMSDALDRAVPWEAGYRHMEGNSAAHVKASMMGSSVQVFVEAGQLQLGTWQGIYLCEFDGPRTITMWIK